MIVLSRIIRSRERDIARLSKELLALKTEMKRMSDELVTEDEVKSLEIEVLAREAESKRLMEQETIIMKQLFRSDIVKSSNRLAVASNGEFRMSFGDNHKLKIRHRRIDSSPTDLSKDQQDNESPSFFNDDDASQKEKIIKQILDMRHEKTQELDLIMADNRELELKIQELERQLR